MCHHKNKAKTGSGECRSCYGKRYYHANKTKLQSAARRRYEESDKSRFRFAHAKCRHGITREEWQRIQNVKACELCGREFPTQRSKQIDHDHSDNHIRGILCNKCNSALGTFGDSIEGLLKAIDYLSRDSGRRRAA